MQKSVIAFSSILFAYWMLRKRSNTVKCMENVSLNTLSVFTASPDFYRNSRGTLMHFRNWAAKTVSKGTVVISHGLGEHCGRYADLALAFNEIGLDVYALDHQGHGQSGGERAYVDDFTHFVDDLYDFVKMVSGASNRFLFGHSMGGNIAIQVANRFPFGYFKGVILSAPALQVDPKLAPKWKIWISTQIARIVPKAPIDRLSSEHMSSDPVSRYMYDVDPLVFHGYLRARFLISFLRAMERVLEESRIVEWPVLVLQGSEDKVVSPKGAQILFSKISSVDKKLVMYDGLFHEILKEREEERIKVVKDIVIWVKDRLDNFNESQQNLTSSLPFTQ